MRTLLALPYLNIHLHEGPQPVLELQWLSFVSSADLQAALTQALHFGRQHQIKGWVTDERLLGAVRPRDIERAEQQLLVPLDKVGLARFAQLESQDALNRRTIDVAYTRTMPTLHYTVQRFEDIIQARRWAGGGA